MTLNLTSDVAADLETLASVRGLSVEECLREMVQHELAVTGGGEPVDDSVSGMILEDGVLIYGAGTALPKEVIDQAIRRSRANRDQHVLGVHT